MEIENHLVSFLIPSYLIYEYMISTSRKFLYITKKVSMRQYLMNNPPVSPPFLSALDPDKPGMQALQPWK